jgi:hypothetical protein
LESEHEQYFGKKEKQAWPLIQTMKSERAGAGKNATRAREMLT